MEEQIKALQAAFEEKLKQAATKEEIAAVSKDMADKLASIKVGVTEEQLKAAQDDFNEKLKAQWAEVEKQLKGKDEVKQPTVVEAIKQALIDGGFTEQVQEGDQMITRVKWDNGDKSNIAFKVKLAFDMNTANALSGVSTGYLTNYGMQPQQLPLSLNVHFMDAFGGQTLGVKEKYFGVVIEGTETDGADKKAETAVAGDSSYLWLTKEYKVFDFAVKFRVHQNTLDDIENVASRIATIGMDRLKSKIDYYALGSAGDNSATPYGMLNAGYFTAYDTTLRAGEVKSANIVNVIKNAVLQAQIADRMVDTVILNGADIAEIEDLKDANDNSVRLAGIVVDATGKLAYIYGLRVIRNNKMTANTAIVCNYESLQFGMRKGFGVRMGYDQTTDFSKNIVTIQVESRLAIGLGAAESIIYISDIASAASDLTVVVN